MCCLLVSSSHPRGEVLSAASTLPNTVRTFIEQLRSDYQVYLELSDIGADWSEHITDRSPFARRATQQLVLCMESCGWQLEPRPRAGATSVLKGNLSTID